MQSRPTEYVSSLAFTRSLLQMFSSPCSGPDLVWWWLWRTPKTRAWFLEVFSSE